MKVKKPECQACGKAHRSFRTAAKCRYGKAYQEGEGCYATLHYNQGCGLLVYLHESKEAAQEFIRQAYTGCAGDVLQRSSHNGIWRFTREGRWMKRW